MARAPTHTAAPPAVRCVADAGCGTPAGRRGVAVRLSPEVKGARPVIHFTMRLRKATRGPMFGRETRMVLRHYLERESVPTSAYHRGQSGDPMDAQELLNQREWEQPENWIGGCGGYLSAGDARRPVRQSK